MPAEGWDRFYSNAGEMESMASIIPVIYRWDLSHAKRPSVHVPTSVKPCNRARGKTQAREQTPYAVAGRRLA